LRATLLYKWKREHYPESLYFYWSVRHSELSAFQWFVALLFKLMTKHEINKSNGNVSAKNRVQVHIYVTSYDSKANAARKQLKDRGSVRIRTPSMRAEGERGIGFTIDELWQALNEPHAPPGEYNKRVSPLPGYTPDNKVGEHIWIWNGRPKWDPAFETVGSEPGAGDKDIGVCFCGSAIVGGQLKDACAKYSMPGKVMFRLHKENF